jgi:hypothetical protein
VAPRRLHCLTVEGVWPIVFLGVVLKIPVFFAIWLVWWAARAEPELEDLPGGEEHGFRRWRRQPWRPRGPRRGSHGGAARPLPDCPPGGRARVKPGSQPAPVAHERLPQPSR